METQKHELGELRQDPLTEKWVVIATNRAKRPDDFKERRAVMRTPVDVPRYKEDCPFCNLVEFPQEPDVLRLPDNVDDWQVHVFNNKFPVFHPKDDYKSWNEGPYRATEAIGYHEILATRWHNHFDGYISERLLALEIEALQLRYRELRVKPAVNYIQIIKNHGPAAGASIEHPHNQIFTVPVLPSDVADMLHGVQKFAEKNNKKAFTVILDFERSEGKRIVWENKHFTVFCPFASRVPFETWVLPRRSNHTFELMTPEERGALAEAMREALGRIAVGLDDPPYNYYIHSAPCDDTGFVCRMDEFPNFRWHIEILPRLSKFAGFELGTGLEINTMAPEAAAEFLRSQVAPSPVE